MRPAIVVLALAVGCGRFAFDPLGGSSGDGDARGSDDSSSSDDGSVTTPDAGATSSTCGSPGDPEPFVGATPACSGWGTVQSSNAVVVEQSGELIVTVAAGGGGGSGGCTGTAAVPAENGVFAHISLVAQGVNGFTTLTATSTAGAFSFQEGNGVVEFPPPASPSSVTYSASSMQWWRIRAEANTVLYETSADGVLWSTQSTAAATVDTWTPSFSAGTDGAATVTQAQFDGVDVCP